jgi:D-lactate dehydrogenase (cytochrome)
MTAGIAALSLPSDARLEEACLRLESGLGTHFSRAAGVRGQHARDAGYHSALLPDGVVFATSTAEVAMAVAICSDCRVPMVPFGAGTSLEGNALAVRGGITISLARMNAVLEVNSSDLDCRVQAGVSRKQLNDYVRADGLFFPIDPGADASLGGMAATRASGTNAVRYGTMRENVLGLTVVLPDGAVINTGGRARKSAAGYDLTRLMIGSEGTLGIITEVQVRLYGVPEAMSAAVCSFATLEGAVNTVIATIQLGVPIARIELLDDRQILAVNRYSGVNYPEQPTLFMEFHGSLTAVREQAETVASLASDQGGGDFQWALAQEERNKLWQVRHDAYWAARSLKPDSEIWTSDVCVPISRLADCIQQTRADIDAHDLIAPLVGHVGDGNFHLLFLVDPRDPRSMERIEQANDRLVRRALAMGGSCTGEHGIGLGKIPYLELEHPSSLPLMRAIKHTIDPHNLMNPGKIFTTPHQPQ